MTDKFINDYKRFLDVWGLDSQMRMCIEEMSELTKELCKYSRYKGTEKEPTIIDNIKEELADVSNVVEQLVYYFGVESIEKIREEKIIRARNKIN